MENRRESIGNLAEMWWEMYWNFMETKGKRRAGRVGQVQGGLAEELGHTFLGS